MPRVRGFNTKILYRLSAVGTLVGAVVLVKDRMGGVKYKGNERMAGKTVIVTGANTGIGKETAWDLARRGGRVILACRDLRKCAKAREEIVQDTANLSVECQELDLASMESIQDFAKTVCEKEKHIDVLVNNAGIMRCPNLLTKDGFEMQLGVNHLGHFLLTNLLLDKLKASAPSRIVTVSSLAHERGEINFADLNSAKHYNPGAAYDQSKLANVLFTLELARRLEGTGVTANALNPGVVKTEIGRHMGISKSYISSAIMKPIKWLMFKTPVEGAQTSIKCTVDAGLENVSGKYFSNCKEQTLSPHATDMTAAKRLWAISEKWTKLT